MATKGINNCFIPVDLNSEVETWGFSFLLSEKEGSMGKGERKWLQEEVSEEGMYLRGENKTNRQRMELKNITV